MARQPQSTGIEIDPAAPALLPGAERISGRHFRLLRIHFQDGSDLHNRLVHTEEWLLHPAESLSLDGNLFVLEDSVRQTGSLFLLPEPLPHARTKGNAADFFCKLDPQQGLHQKLNGDWVKLPLPDLSPLTRTRILRDWQRRQRPSHPSHQTPLLLSNTWGDRSRDGRMHAEFIRAEILAAAGIGVDLVQLDDGWQKGVTVNSVHADRGGVWEGFWNTDPHFWDAHPERFPDGLAPLAELARQHQVGLGLWFAPDSWNNFAHWERDADRILALHSEFGICHFKLDGIKLHRPEGLRNLRAFADKVIRESHGAVCFDLDVTAETRPGPWGMANAGYLFLQNRYTDWTNYWPHQTLRTLWQLAPWVDPLRLRMEFLNTARNRESYRDDPLAPANYAADTLFAMIMIAQPLGWFELTGLDPQFTAALSKILRIWRAHRDAMAACTVLPVGRTPDGWGFSGFHLVPGQPDAPQYLILFRGAGPASTHTFTSPAPFAANWTPLHGQGRVSVSGDTLHAELPNPFSHLWLTAP